MTTMTKMIQRVRLELQDTNLETPDGEAESFDTVEDKDIETFVNEQLLFQTQGRSDANGVAYTLATLPPIEVPLLAMLVAVQVFDVLINEAAREITVHAGEGLTINSPERFMQLMQVRQFLWQKYSDLAMALNVGIHRIEVSTLRRVSRTTGRLVPLYKEQEYDDLAYPPVRILPGIDAGDAV